MENRSTEVRRGSSQTIQTGYGPSEQPGNGPHYPVGMGGAARNVDGWHSRSGLNAHDICGVGLSCGNPTKTGTSANTENRHSSWRQLFNRSQGGHLVAILVPQHAGMTIEGSRDAAFNRQDETLIGSRGIAQDTHGICSSSPHEGRVVSQVDGVNEQVGHVRRRA